MAKKIITDDKGKRRYVLRDSDGRFKEITTHSKGRAFGFVERVALDPKGGGSYAVVKRFERSMPKNKPVKPEYQPKLAYPVENRADPKSFAANLLKTDKVILDYLAK